MGRYSLGLPMMIIDDDEPSYGRVRTVEAPCGRLIRVSVGSELGSFSDKKTGYRIEFHNDFTRTALLVTKEEAEHYNTIQGTWPNLWIAVKR